MSYRIARIRMSFRRDTMKRKMVTVLAVLIAHLPVLQSAQAFPDRPINWSYRRPQVDRRMSQVRSPPGKSSGHYR
jgi:hypothetical protein